MPKLIIFAPCDNVLVNQDAESASLIVILSGVRIPIPPEAIIPEKAMAPMRWFVFCQWLIVEDEVGVSFEQRIRFFEELGFLNNVSKFTPEAGNFQRTITGLFGFPIVKSGTYSIFVDIRKTGDEEWVNAGTYPLMVEQI